MSLRLSATTVVSIGVLLLEIPFGFAGRTEAAEKKPGTVTVFVGTYTGGESKGIYRFDFDLATGKASDPVVAAETTNPSFLAIDPTRRFLYAVAEVDSFRGKKGGGVSAFAIEPKAGGLIFLNAESTGGEGPCHLVVDKGGKNVLVANYGGGSVAVLPVDQGGRLKAASAFIQHQGASIRPARQKQPHAHSVNLDSANRFAFVADLGLDKVLVYGFDPEKGSLVPHDPPAAGLSPGAGPRHFAFHPSGKFAYAINELNSTVQAWSYDPKRGVLTAVQSISTLPQGFSGGNAPAEVQVHPSGRFLYGSNRGHNSIVVYTIDPETGKLRHVENESKGIKNPRNFGIDSTGTYLLAASQDLDSIVVFRIDPETGELKATGETVRVPKPVCIKFWSSPE
jgi:6-phosphogluconolactonase